MITNQMDQVAEWINIVGEFCGVRDIPSLTREAVRHQYGYDQADIMVLFGGSILSGGDDFACGIQNQVAGKSIIVGGEGHTTGALRRKIQQEFPDIQPEGMMEAEIFSAYLSRRYGLKPDFIETKSTNCGNNIQYLLKMLEENGVSFHSVILIQDAAMQRRMEAGMRKYCPPDIEIINYAAYQANVIPSGTGLAYEKPIGGMWEPDRYLSLLLGEIPRLTDDENGYGPKGKAYISHVDIPEKVLQAFNQLRERYQALVRLADPSYASK